MLRLIEENHRRGRNKPEFELLDTGIFDDNRYFDVFIEYAKSSPNDVLMRITAANRGPEAALLHLLPTLWFRNTWVWGCAHEGCWPKPRLYQADQGTISCEHVTLGRYKFCAGPGPDGRMPQLLFTENETNFEKLFHSRNEKPYVKDAFHEYIVGGRNEAINPESKGTKAAAHYALEIPAAGEIVINLRLFAEEEAPSRAFGPEFDGVFAQRIREADDFYEARISSGPVGGKLSHQPPGLCGASLVEAVLSLRGERMARRRSGHAASSGKPEARPKLRLAAPVQSRRDLHAG